MTIQSGNPQSVIHRIQTGDSGLREQFISESIPFIKGVVRHVTHSWFVEQADEYSIALEAFNQAISHYKVDGDVPFEPYARLLIRNRLLDWIRCQKHVRQELTMTDCETDEGPSPIEQLADPKSDCIQQDLEFVDAMATLEMKLQRFGLSFARLTSTFPKHQDSRLLCIRIARELTSNNALSSQLVLSGRVPCAELARRCKVPVKTIEKNRSSIILLTLLMQSDLEVIKSYMTNFEREGSR